MHISPSTKDTQKIMNRKVLSWFCWIPLGDVLGRASLLFSLKRNRELGLCFIEAFSSLSDTGSSSKLALSGVFVFHRNRWPFRVLICVYSAVCRRGWTYNISQWRGLVGSTWETMLFLSGSRLRFGSPDANGTKTFRDSNPFSELPSSFWLV